MPEFGWIAAAGSIGGIVAAFFLGQPVPEVEIPDEVKAFLRRPTVRLIYRVLRSAILGALASLIVWALETAPSTEGSVLVSSAVTKYTCSFAESSFNVIPFIISIGVGLGGVSFIGNFVRQRELRQEEASSNKVADGLTLMYERVQELEAENRRLKE